MFSGSQCHVPEDTSNKNRLLCRKNCEGLISNHNSEKLYPLNRRDAFFENIEKDFQSEESAEKRVRKFLDTENTLYGFYSILNLRLKFWSASPNLFSDDS